MSEMQKLFKKDLVVNGVKQHVLVTGEEMLVDVIRQQLGLTGTKVGCRINQCGICSVILEGKVAVSYTHLDVYKRQAKRNNRCLLFEKWPDKRVYS